MSHQWDGKAPEAGDCGQSYRADRIEITRRTNRQPLVHSCTRVALVERGNSWPAKERGGQDGTINGDPKGCTEKRHSTAQIQTESANKKIAKMCGRGALMAGHIPAKQQTPIEKKQLLWHLYDLQLI